MSTGKKILFITYDGMTDPLGQSQIIPYLQFLSGLGYKITLLSTEKKHKLQSGKSIVEKILADSGIKWEAISFTTQPPLIAKMIDQWKLNRAAARLYKKEQFDLIHCRSYVSAAAAIKLWKKYRVPFLFDMRGFWVDERVDNGQWNLRSPIYKFLYRVYKKKEKNYLQSAAHIISLTEKGRKELTAVYHVPDQKITVIPCCVDLEHFDFHKITPEQKNNLRNELGIGPTTAVLSYLGSLGGWYMTNEMLDFFAVLKERMKDMIFLFITHNNKDEILRLAASRGIEEKFIRVKAAARTEVPLSLSLSDWSIFFIKDAYSKRASSPTKQGEIMAMGIPVICNDIGDTGSIIDRSGAGLLVNKFEKKEYERVISIMTDNGKPESSKIRNAAFQYYNLRDGGELYASVYRRLTDNKE